MKKTILISLISILCTNISLTQNPTKRRLNPSDVYRLQNLADPQISPDGNWIAYTLSTVDSVKNKRNSDIWMASWDGKESIQMTFTPEGESQPRWSPDGKYLSFVAARGSAPAKDQIWVLDRRGGEARQLTDIKATNELMSYEWSPDGKKIALVIKTNIDTSKMPKPILIDRYHFKKDMEGYLGRKPIHLFLFDVANKKMEALTKGIYDETNPKWSPNGYQIAFVSNRSADPDRNSNEDIYVMDANPESQLRQITKWAGKDYAPLWSPDGKQIAYLRSSFSNNYTMYDQDVLCVIDKDGGEPKLLSNLIDRPVDSHCWSKDGTSLLGVVTDDCSRYVAKFNLSDLKVTTVADGFRCFYGLQRHPSGNYMCTISDPQMPAEVYKLENGKVFRISKHQDDFLAPISLAMVEGFTSKSKDGTQVSSLLFRHKANGTGQKLPTVLLIHGGPVAQSEYAFDLSRQMLAAAGYAVATINYRGSNGRGLDYCKSISADWGNKEVMDILGACDHLVKNGIADPNRLGIGGWSYGGILTDYTIASDTRFKAAISGAGQGLFVSAYGTDQYTLQYDTELGAPWKNLEKYVQLSYPFLKAEQIKTPTLFMVGEKDFNVPVLGSEQMYQALKTLNIPTELVIYPDQFHGLTNPRYEKDRFERYIAWYNKYLRN